MDRPSLISEKIDIKIFILFLIRRVHEPVTFDELFDLILSDGDVNYFDYSSCLSELLQTGHLVRVEEKYALTEKGERNVDITEKNIPFSVRQKGENSASALARSLQRGRAILTASKARDHGGCTTALSLSDDGGELLNISLYSVNAKQSALIEKNFSKNAEKIYNQIVTLLTEARL